MSYNQAVKWSRKHPKGTRPPLIMSTNSGFWPSQAWLQSDYWPYCRACEAAGLEPWDAERFYNRTIRRDHFPRTPSGYVAMMKEGTL